MPDGDVYDRKIDRGWQTAARRVFESDDDELALPSLLRAIGRAIKDGGCPGFDAVVAIVVDAVGSQEISAARREATAGLDRVRRMAGSERTGVVVDAAKRLLADPSVVMPADADRRNRETARVKVAAWLVIELAVRKFSPGALLQEQVENRGVPIEVYRRRAERARSLLASSPDATRLADQLLAHPDGVGVKTPRPKMPKPSQESLVHIAISA